MSKQSLLKAFSDFLDTVSGGTGKGAPEVESVVKSLDEDLMQATFVVLEACPDETTFDLHGDTYDAAEVAKACHDYNRNCMKANLAHMFMVDDDIAYVVESYTTPVDIHLDETFISKGSWLQTWQIKDASIWEGIKSGYWSGLSIQCLAEVEDLTND